MSRSDLVHALATISPSANRINPPSDRAIRGRLLAELERQTWWRPLVSSVVVAGGVVQYSGIVDSEDQRNAARVAAENVPGVRGVEDRRFNYYDVSSMV